MGKHYAQNEEVYYRKSSTNFGSDAVIKNRLLYALCFVFRVPDTTPRLLINREKAANRVKNHE